MVNVKYDTSFLSFNRNFLLILILHVMFYQKNCLYINLFIIQSDGVNSIWPSLPFKQALNKLHKHIQLLATKGDWDFRISDLVKNPDGTDI